MSKQELQNQKSMIDEWIEKVKSKRESLEKENPDKNVRVVFNTLKDSLGWGITFELTPKNIKLNNQ